MSTTLYEALEALKNLDQYYDDIYNQDFSDIREREQYDIIEKAIKENQNKVMAFDIIANKDVGLEYLKFSDTYEDYCYKFMKWVGWTVPITKEQFYLIKEAIKNASL